MSPVTRKLTILSGLLLFGLVVGTGQPIDHFARISAQMITPPSPPPTGISSPVPSPTVVSCQQPTSMPYSYHVGDQEVEEYQDGDQTMRRVRIPDLHPSCDPSNDRSLNAYIDPHPSFEYLVVEDGSRTTRSANIYRFGDPTKTILTSWDCISLDGYLSDVPLGLEFVKGSGFYHCCNNCPR